MFGQCCGTPPLANKAWGITVIAYARLAGFNPLVLDYAVYDGAGSDPYTANGTGPQYHSSSPILEARYLSRVTYTEWGMSNGGVDYTRWKREEKVYNLEMGDIEYWLQEDSINGTTYEYILDDDGGTSTTGTVDSGILAPNEPGYTTPSGQTTKSGTGAAVENSRTASFVSWSRTNTATNFWNKTITLADDAEWVTGGTNSRQDAADTLLAGINIETPGDDYSPGVAQRYEIDGVERVLCPVPTEYLGDPEVGLYFQHNPVANNADWRIYYAMRRTAGGLAAGASFTPDSFISGLFPTNFNPSGLGTSYPVYACASRGGKTAPSVLNNASDSTVFGGINLTAFRAKSKVLLSEGGSFKYGNTGKNTSGIIENATATAWSFTGGPPFALAQATRKVMNGAAVVIPPPESTFAGPTEVVTWKPYWVIIADDMASHSETNACVVLHL